MTAGEGTPPTTSDQGRKILVTTVGPAGLAGPRGPSAEGLPLREADLHVVVPRPPPPRVTVVDHHDERPRWVDLADGLGGPRRVGTDVLGQPGLTEQAARVAAVDLQHDPARGHA